VRDKKMTTSADDDDIGNDQQLSASLQGPQRVCTAFTNPQGCLSPRSNDTPVNHGVTPPAGFSLLTANGYRAKCILEMFLWYGIYVVMIVSAAFSAGSKGSYSSFHLRIHVWVARKAV